MEKATLTAIQADVAAALAQIGQTHGVTVFAGTATARDITGAMRFSVVENDEDGNPRNPFEADFSKHGEALGFTEEDLGREFFFKNKLYTFEGTQSRAFRYPAVARRADGKVRRLTVADVKGAFAELEAVIAD